MELQELKDKYPDINHDVSWTRDLRLPVIDSFHPRLYYIVTLAYPREGENLLYPDTAVPTDEEARIIASYMEYRMAKFDYRPWWAERVHAGAFDVDPGVNTVSFMKRLDGTWVYVRASWRNSFPFPYPDSPFKFHNVHEILDHLTEYETETWSQWKSEHGL